MERRYNRNAERTGPVRFRTTFRNVIYDVFKARGWRETDSETDWDVAWIDTGWLREFFDQMHLEDQQVINHYRNHYELTRKDLLIKNLKRMQRQLVREDRLAEAARFDFFPSTYVLPADYGLFVEEFKQQVGAIWIMKPIGKAQGKGIFLFNKLSHISEWKKDSKWRPNSERNAETQVRSLVRAEIAIAAFMGAGPGARWLWARGPAALRALQQPGREGSSHPRISEPGPGPYRGFASRPAGTCAPARAEQRAHAQRRPSALPYRAARLEPSNRRRGGLWVVASASAGCAPFAAQCAHGARWVRPPASC
jgi:hypothetical protein